MNKSVPYHILSDGNRMPAIGLGTMAVSFYFLTLFNGNPIEIEPKKKTKNKYSVLIAR